MKLTGSMSFLSILSSFFRLLVSLQVDGPLGVVLGGSKGLSVFGPEPQPGYPGSPGPLWGVPIRSRGSLAALGAYVVGPGLLGLNESKFMTAVG